MPSHFVENWYWLLQVFFFCVWVFWLTIFSSGIKTPFTSIHNIILIHWMPKWALFSTTYKLKCSILNLKWITFNSQYFRWQLSNANGWFNPLNPTGGIEDGAEAISEGANCCYCMQIHLVYLHEVNKKIAYLHEVYKKLHICMKLTKVCTFAWS